MSKPSKKNSDTENEEIEMYVAGLVLDPGSNAPIVVLKDSSGELCLPIWIGLAEASAIASHLRNVSVSRPMTHDLLTTILDSVNVRVIKVLIRGIDENTFLANIELVDGDVLHTLDARPSDAIAIAIRAEAPIFVKEKVLSEAKVSLVSIDLPEEDKASQEKGTSEVFCSMDKEEWEEILAEMDPDDFKYKM